MIKNLRERTGLGLVDAKRIVEEADGDWDKALSLASKSGRRVNPGRETKQGRVETYNHGGRVASIVEILCETDFVSRNEGFKELCREVAMQVASMNPRSIADLMDQNYIRDSKSKVSDLVSQFASQCGENIKINRIDRFELNEDIVDTFGRHVDSVTAVHAAAAEILNTR